MPTPLPWSHSSLNGFDTCARQYEATKVIKIYKQVSSEASIWGDQLHQAAEKYLKGEAPLGERFKEYQNYLDGYKQLPGQLFAEREYAIDKNLKPCAFLGPDVWGRGIIDVLHLNGFHADVFDHKTGKRKKDMQQLRIFALLVFYHHPEITECRTRFEWLKDGTHDEETFQRVDIPAMWETLIPKLERYVEAFHSGIFPPKPSGLCKQYCPVKTCEYWGVGMYRR